MGAGVRSRAMRKMTEQEWRAFVMDGTRTAKVATARKDGRPHVVPVWFVLDGDDVVFTTTATSVKGTALRRDRYACLCVDDQAPPFSFVMVECPRVGRDGAQFGVQPEHNSPTLSLPSTPMTAGITPQQKASGATGGRAVAGSNPVSPISQSNGRLRRGPFACPLAAPSRRLEAV